ncbi:MAG: DUF167 family protein [Alphaproteobacteria bacterium]|jgi:hypothetical protein|nr:DUF167 family protein [Alphaproteobacteria bacterium]MDP7642803.1 DUF167 family protein [Alphaproteobacteria bacterium]
MGGSAPYGVNDRGVRLAVRLTPKAGRAGIRGIALAADGGAYVKAGVTAPAEGGKANRALIKLLARELGLPASAMHIASGNKDRRKSVQIAGDPAQLKKRLELFCGEIK